MDENLESTQDAGATKHILIQLLIYNPNIELIQLFLMEFQKWKCLMTYF